MAYYSWAGEPVTKPSVLTTFKSTAYPTGNVVAFTPPPGEDIVFAVVIEQAVVPTVAGADLLLAVTSGYCDILIYGRHGNNGASVSISGVPSQCVVVGAVLADCKPDWLTGLSRVSGPNTLTTASGTMPSESLMLAFLGGLDSQVLVPVTQPASFTKNEEAVADFGYRQLTMATKNATSTSTENVVWQTDPGSASSAILGIPGIPLTVVEEGPTFLCRSADNTKWERRKLYLRNLANTGWEWLPGVPIQPFVSKAEMLDIRSKTLSPTSIFKTSLASQPAGNRVVDTTSLGNNGQPLAYNMKAQFRYNNVTPVDTVLSYNPPGYQTSINYDKFGIPIYVVPLNQPKVEMWYSTWGVPWAHIGRGPNTDIEGLTLAVPMPTLALCNPGNNGLLFSRAAASGATTIYSHEEMYGMHRYAGVNFTIDTCTRVGTTSEFQLTITPGLAAPAVAWAGGNPASNNSTTRPFQIEANGGDKSAIILQKQADGKISQWEFWGLRPNKNAPGGWSYGNAGYKEDTRDWDGIFTGTTHGMRACGISAVAGLVLLEHMQDATNGYPVAPGCAISVTGTVSGSTHKAPAIRYDGEEHAIVQGGDSRHKLSLGTRFTLPADIWTNSFIDALLAGTSQTTAQKVASKNWYISIRENGYFLNDTAGATVFYGEGKQSVGTPYNPHTLADLAAYEGDQFEWLKVPEFHDAVVALQSIPLPDPPGTITPVTTSRTSTTITINWTAASGDYTETAYNLFKNNGYHTTVGTNTFSYTYTGLTPNTSYIVGVEATSGLGGGPRVSLTVVTLA